METIEKKQERKGGVQTGVLFSSYRGPEKRQGKNCQKEDQRIKTAGEEMRNKVLKHSTTQSDS